MKEMNLLKMDNCSKKYINYLNYRKEIRNGVRAFVLNFQLEGRTLIILQSI